MMFTKFMALLEDTAELLSEAPNLMARPQPQSVAWDPKGVSQFKGQGFSSDPQSHKLDRQVDTDDDAHGYNQMHGTAKTVEPKQGDIVVVQDQAGNSTPGLVTGISNGNAQIVNNKKNVNVTRPVSSLGLAPAAMAQQMSLGGRGDRNVWMYRA